MDAMSWLDHLLELSGEQRELQLQLLRAEDPELHARLVRMLATAEGADNSGVLADPVIGGLRAASRVTTLALEPGQTVSGYRLLRELGRGGMSVVWLAERSDGVIKREVALKLPLQFLRTREDVDRFAREKDVLAALSHANIARIYDAGVTSSGQPFVVLEYVAGLPITVYCDNHNFNLRARIELFLQVLAAVEHAHTHLFVHRDIKPSNILVDENSQAKLLDFGIAKLISPDGELLASHTTEFGTRMLTPTYGAPEQVTGESITTLADVYSLGVVLFELLTGSLPFSAKLGATPSLAAILDALRHEPVPSLTQVVLLDGAPRHRAHIFAIDLRSELRGDLDAIVQKALRKSPRDRYASVERFASDLRSFLSGMPIDARPPSLWYSLRLLVRRQRNATIAGTVGVLVTIVAVILIVRQHYETREQEARVAAVRNFMFELVNDVEPDESSQSGLVTAKQMLDGAAYRARRDFAGQPRLLGELIGELGRMYSRVGESDIARESLIEAVNILEARAPRQDPFLNKMRANLADEYVDSNDFSRAKELATAALRDCTLPDKECKKALAYAESVLSEVHLASGKVADALAAMQRSVAHYVSGFGPRDAETALANVRLATIARNAGQVLVAKQAIDNAVALTKELTLNKSDRYQVHLISAIIEFDLGQYARAYDGLTRLLPDAGTPLQRQTILRLMANAQVARGDVRLARQHVEAALEVEGPQTSVQALFARETYARIASLQGEHELARGAIEKVVGQLTATGRQPDAPEMLRAQRTFAEIHLRAGRLSDAHSLLKTQLKVADHSDLELALATELLGNLYQAQGNSAEALNTHRNARVLLQKSLPANHPFLLRNTLYIAAASNDLAAVQETSGVLSKIYAENSIWQSIIEQQYVLQTERVGGSPYRLLVL